ncbi:hypothetical protein GCM10028817_26610 [Spirosoma pomorum]
MGESGPGEWGWLESRSGVSVDGRILVSAGRACRVISLSGAGALAEEFCTAADVPGAIREWGRSAKRGWEMLADRAAGL